jgi:hypothetical protein
MNDEIRILVAQNFTLKTWPCALVACHNIKTIDTKHDWHTDAAACLHNKQNSYTYTVSDANGYWYSCYGVAVKKKFIKNIK